MDNTAPKQPLILVVDDAVDIATVQKFILEVMGKYRAEMATSGTKALEKARTLHPDLILLDSIMPPPNGWECCKILKQDPETQHIPILMCGTLSGEEYRTKSLEAGALDYVVLPRGAQDIVELVRRVLASNQR
jgi:CheY-like chemotaxis protein